MKKLILQTEKRCFICGREDGLHRHHVFYGTGKRKQSEKWNCVVWLCGPHHNLSDNSVHHNHELDLKVKRYAQQKFEDIYGHEMFMEIFHKNYL